MKKIIICSFMAILAPTFVFGNIDRANNLCVYKPSTCEAKELPGCEEGYLQFEIVANFKIFPFVDYNSELRAEKDCETNRAEGLNLLCYKFDSVTLPGVSLLEYTGMPIYFSDEKTCKIDLSN